MSKPSKQHGTFSWSELRTSDPEQSKDFYSSLLGWEMEDLSIEDKIYTVFKAGGKAVGGIVKISSKAVEASASWGTYVTVDNVDAAATKAEKMGGKILVPPQDLPNGRRFGVIQDPQGAVLTLTTYAGVK